MSVPASMFTSDFYDECSADHCFLEECSLSEASEAGDKVFNLFGKTLRVSDGEGEVLERGARAASLVSDAVEDSRPYPLDSRGAAYWAPAITTINWDVDLMRARDAENGSKSVGRGFE